MLVARVRDDARRLVDGKQMLILEKHVERQLLGLWQPTAHGRRKRRVDAVASHDACRGPRDDAAIDRDSAVLDCPLDTAPRQREPSAQVPQYDEVQANAVIAPVGNQRVPFEAERPTWWFRRHAYILSSCG